MARWERWSAVGDIHGDMHDPNAVSAYLDFVKNSWKPKYRILLGDCFDFRAIRKNAAKHEQADSMQQDIHCGIQYISQLRPTVWLRGNHDERVWDIAKFGSGLIGDFAKQAVQDLTKLAARIKCPVIPYNKRTGIFKLGDTKFIHGYHAGVGAARRHATVYGKSVGGHVHSGGVGCAERDDQLAMHYESCCQCLLEMEYDRAQTAGLRHEHGWTYGVYNTKTGENVIWQAKSVDGQYVCPDGLIFSRATARKFSLRHS